MWEIENTSVSSQACPPHIQFLSKSSRETQSPADPPPLPFREAKCRNVNIKYRMQRSIRKLVAGFARVAVVIICMAVRNCFYEWKRSQARSQIRKNSSRFARCDSGLSRPAPKGPRLLDEGPWPRGGLAPSSYSARFLLRLLLLLLMRPPMGEGGVGGWCPP